MELKNVDLEKTIFILKYDKSPKGEQRYFVSSLVKDDNLVITVTTNFMKAKRFNYEEALRWTLDYLSGRDLDMIKENKTDIYYTFWQKMKDHFLTISVISLNWGFNGDAELERKLVKEVGIDFFDEKPEQQEIVVEE